ncbi:DUF4256 domain-containing protein [Salinimicrobium sp. HB62]|uniref:DUF4256 domain-containing protein n=1 Tax=Salinimicrobium sp. HB62 TaxID=3077781 RepID=UPI002D77145C|nr:DUF4256 domain-containing protein [Salinimicrobium sp. HB62]
MAELKELSAAQQEELLTTLKSRFDENKSRHEGLEWDKVEHKLKSNPAKMLSLHEMERTGGEPDIVGMEEKSGAYIFYDCSAESPKGRRSVCYDPEALASRKKFPPKNSAVELAAKMGIELLSEEQYRELQQLGTFDTKTSSWLKTPEEIRKLGGAIFGDFRFGRVFIYHNGAESYYAARGFRGILKV